MVGMTCKHCVPVTYSEMGDTHEYWCRENISLKVRQRAYAVAMIGNGHSPSQVATWMVEDEKLEVSQ